VSTLGADERVERGVEFTQALSRVARGDERPEFNTTKAPEHGTGLGLSQIREFAHRACGAIALESELGRGTTATLYLPRAIERASGRRRNRQHQRGDRHRAGRGEGIKNRDVLKLARSECGLAAYNASDVRRWSVIPCRLPVRGGAAGSAGGCSCSMRG